ncbi:oxygen-independent coproporphyrinogen III oxidase-like protein, partial [Xylella fastidiosa subsp. multiplex]|nr:oxygen-independent coproporphyrinogen III oxidase-like protein [Xylella fastidiosa subsp. multiplex]
REGWQCLHNLNYWRFGDYLGIGAGAHGKITSGVSQHVLRRWKCEHPYTYLDNACTVSAIGGDEIVPPPRLPFEYMLNLLRLREGFRLQDFALRTGLTVESIHAAL